MIKEFYCELSIPIPIGSEKVDKILIKYDPDLLNLYYSVDEGNFTYHAKNPSFSMQNDEESIKKYLESCLGIEETSFVQTDIHGVPKTLFAVVRVAEKNCFGDIDGYRDTMLRIKIKSVSSKPIKNQIEAYQDKYYKLQKINWEIKKLEYQKRKLFKVIS